MPRWDDPRGPRHDSERDRWRRDEIRGRGGRAASDWRSFGADVRYAARYDQDRIDYGRHEEEDAGAAGYAPHPDERSAAAYGEQSGLPYGAPDYGPESEGGFGGGAGAGPGWGLERNSDRRRNFDFDDPGVGQSQAGYGQRSQSDPDHDFDPDYLRWRDAQLRGHDRDYQDWRREQHRQYDEEYRRFRSERQRHFGQAFHEWRSQRSAAGGTPDTPGHLDPAMSQRGGLHYDPDAARQAPSHGEPEFGKEPSQVQASSEGAVQGEARKDEERRH